MTYRCKDKRGRYYVGGLERMTRRQRLRASLWLLPHQMSVGTGFGSWFHPEGPRMVARQTGTRVVRCYDVEESRARAEARGEVRALLAVTDLLGAGTFYARKHQELLADARRRAGVPVR